MHGIGRALSILTDEGDDANTAVGNIVAGGSKAVATVNNG